jgi:amino acid adenylation domain-containing protein
MSDLAKIIEGMPAEKRDLLMRQLRGKRKADKQRPITRQPRHSNAFPLSFAQQRLWFMDQLVPQHPFYNVPEMIRLKGALNCAALQKAITEIVRRHESLRTRFSTVAGQAMQIITDPSDVPTPMLDLSAIAEPEREAYVQYLTFEEARRPFDLSKGPLIRTALLKLSDSEHVLLLLMHHIISDVWSIKVFLRELHVIYLAYCEGKQSPLPDPLIQYVDYAIWQREQMQGEALESHLSYWRKQLEEFEALHLPMRKPRPASFSFEGAVHNLALSKDVSERLKQLSQDQGVTMFMLMLAAFKVLLYRYTGQENILVATPSAGRNRAELEPIIGFFVNNLLMRTDLSGNPTFCELLHRVREVALAAYAHKEVPFEKFVEQLPPSRDTNRNPLSQIFFAYDGFSAPVTFPPLTISVEAVYNNTAKFDLFFSFKEKPEGIKGRIEYSTDLYDEATVASMSTHLCRLLEAIAAQPDRKVTRLEMLGEVEKKQILEGWNDTRSEYGEASLREMFERQVERRGGETAVEYEGRGMSYEELNRRANQLGRYLRRKGVREEEGVGVCMERSMEMVMAVLGVMKAGGVYVPLDAGYPKERLRMMIEDAGLSLILTQERLAGQLPRHGAEVICVDEICDVIAQESEDNPPVMTTADNLAYVMYTSGSTGRPKGVAVPQRAVIRLVHNTNYIQLSASDNVAQVSNFSFDAATFEIFGALLNGARLVVIPTAVILSASEFAAKIKEENITAMFITTALFNQLSSQSSRIFSPIRTLMTGGESHDPRAMKRVLERDRPERLMNVYGPTESTTFATWCLIEEAADERGPIPIGIPLSNTQTYVLDPDFQPVPVGVTGELYIGGDGLARGYYGLPDLTAEKFVPHPFSADPGQRLYRTGDLARFLPDGRVDFIGRKDHQVKVRGFRIELGEIEAVLESYPPVGQCVVVMREDTPNDKRVVAYVVAGEGQALSVSQLRGYLNERLPDYMVPSAFVELDYLPLTPNGKVDRNALPAPQSSEAAEEFFVAPRTLVEEAVADIWAEALNVERVGVFDNFFEMGGHSLLAAQIITDVRDAFRMNVPLRSIFEKPTVADLSALLISVEVRPGLCEKVAGLLKKIKSMSPEERKEILERKDLVLR